MNEVVHAWFPVQKVFLVKQRNIQSTHSRFTTATTPTHIEEKK